MQEQNNTAFIDRGHLEETPTAESRRDLEEIVRYTIAELGEGQTESYLKKIRQCFKNKASSPTYLEKSSPMHKSSAASTATSSIG